MKCSKLPVLLLIFFEYYYTILLYDILAWGGYTAADLNWMWLIKLVIAGACTMMVNDQIQSYGIRFV